MQQRLVTIKVFLASPLLGSVTLLLHYMSICVLVHVFGCPSKFVQTRHLHYVDEFRNDPVHLSCEVPCEVFIQAGSRSGALQGQMMKLR